MPKESQKRSRANMFLPLPSVFHSHVNYYLTASTLDMRLAESQNITRLFPGVLIVSVWDMWPAAAMRRCAAFAVEKNTPQVTAPALKNQSVSGAGAATALRTEAVLPTKKMKLYTQ